MPRSLNFGDRLGSYAYTDLADDARVNILEGSVRSGKTWAHIPKIIQAGHYPVSGWRVMTGVTKSTVYENVLNDLFNFIGPSNYNYNHQSGMLRLFKARWLVIGAKDEGSEKYIRGKTIGIAVCDEVTLMPEEFFKMLLTRMSPPGSRLYGTTNTDSPLHYLKRDYLDNQELIDSGLLRSIHCTMDDNPNLTEEYKESQRKFYTGLFYQRFILGKWVMAEGVIYRDSWGKQCEFDDADRPVGLSGAGGTKERVIVIDYGTTNPFVALDFRDDGKMIWVDDEYRWDSIKEMRQKTDGEYCRDLTKWLNGDKTPQIIIDPSAASMKAELTANGFWVTDAKNDVASGIQKTSTALSKGVLRFHRKRCRRTIDEFQVYSWDKKKALHGLEEPVKSEDHGPDAARYFCETKLPLWRLI
jgi:PBSX family phage terminase large subunit